MPVKISANVLKHGRTTRSVLRQGSLQLQKYKAARMSRRIAIDQKVCGWDGGHPGLTVWNLLNYTRIENAHEVPKNIFVFYCVAVICAITKGKEKIRACVSRRGGAREVPGEATALPKFCLAPQNISGLFLKVLHRPLTAPLVAKLAPPVALPNENVWLRPWVTGLNFGPLWQRTPLLGGMDCGWYGSDF